MIIANVLGSHVLCIIINHDKLYDHFYHLFGYLGLVIAPLLRYL